MNYLSLLTKDEVIFICSVIPFQDTIAYFTQNPKEFAKIRPGFRAKAITRLDARNLLFNNYKRKFVSFFIEKHIKNWLTRINEHCIKYMDGGDSKDIALINTLPFSFFAGNVSIYFKLVDEEFSNEYIVLMSATIKVIKDIDDKKTKFDNKTKELEFECKNLQTEIQTKSNELIIFEKKLSNQLLEIGILKGKISIFEQCQDASNYNKELIESLKSENIILKDRINLLSTEIDGLKYSSQLLEEKIREELEEQRCTCDDETEHNNCPKRPCDIEEFKEYLEYNLINIGVQDDCEYLPLLLSYLSRILFRGIPIVLNQSISTNIIKCVANSLIGTSSVKSMIFDQNITPDKINEFLSSTDRIVCLESFLGNYNETELIPILEKHKDKIIFLTVVYDRTLHYLSKEFLRYCHYFNANRVVGLSSYNELSEDPSTIPENSYEQQNAKGENRLRNLYRKILHELSFLQSVIEYKSESILNDEDICQSLVFDILPFCTDVLLINPFNTSEQLTRYAGISGRCPNKNLLERWFAQ